MRPARLPLPCRPASVEIDLAQLRRNFQVINRDKPKSVRILSVIKDDAYGHGALPVAKVAVAAGVHGFAVFTVGEAIALREGGIQAPILMLGARHPSEIPLCLKLDLAFCLIDGATARALARAHRGRRKPAPVHLKIDTGMSRYGIRWNEAGSLLKRIWAMPALRVEGVMSHFAMSDEIDKTFAHLQLDRFREVLSWMQAHGLDPGLRHICNSGGFLDLPEAHFDMIRLGILPLGVYPSQVCRRLPGIAPVMTVKAHIACLQTIQKGDTVGYGMRYQAPSQRRIAVLPLGYGDGFPRVRNQGQVLVHGVRVPIVGGVSMDSITVDVTSVPNVRLWDEAVIMGRQRDEEISVHEIAALKNSVSYDVLTGWRHRLPRVYRS